MKQEEKIKQIEDLIQRYGGIQGDHHRAWVLDQVMRIIKGDKYHQWVIDEEKAGYPWEHGIAP